MTPDGMPLSRMASMSARALLAAFSFAFSAVRFGKASG
jgi:hypothetical protein